MKNLLLFCIPFLFLFSCEKDEEASSCTDSERGDLIVGEWNVDTEYYYDGGTLFDCITSCGASNDVCLDMDCEIITYDCDGTGSIMDVTFTWTYDEDDDLITATRSDIGLIYSYIDVVSSNMMVYETDLIMITDDGDQIPLTAVTSMTR